MGVFVGFGNLVCRRTAAVAARVAGQVAKVLVDDNYRVRKGDLLDQLDKEPFQIAVAIKKAAVDTATADLQVARSKVRGIEAEAMSRRRGLQHAMENVDNQVALLRAKAKRAMLEPEAGPPFFLKCEGGRNGVRWDKVRKVKDVNHF